MTYKPLALAAAALVAGFLSLGGAGAANVMSGGATAPGLATSQDANVQQVSHRKKWRHWRGNGNDNRRWRHRRHGGSAVWLGLGLAPFYGSYYAPYYAPYYAQPTYYPRARGSRHVRWCLERYRSYDMRSNTFMGFDGDRHRCRSPYRT